MSTVSVSAVAAVGVVAGLLAAPTVAVGATSPPAERAAASAKKATKGKLRVVVRGLPDPAKAVKVKGPRKYRRTLTTTTTLKKLVPGRYVLKAMTVTTEFNAVYEPSPKKRKVSVKAGKKKRTRFQYRDLIDGPSQQEPIRTISPTPSTIPSTSTTPEPPPGLPVKSLSAGTSHSCAVRNDGAVFCWGNNRFGQLGDGTTTRSASPRKVVDITDAAAVDVGEASSCAILAGGGAVCWGRNSAGELGNGDGGDGTHDHDSPIPVEVVAASGPLSTVTDIAVGQDHACALESGGSTPDTVWCWGGDRRGQIGKGRAGGEEPLAVRLTRVGPGPLQVGAGSEYSCVRLRNGGVECWGANDKGQLGTSSTRQSDAPTTVALGQAAAADLQTGDDHACAMISPGDFRCWGDNSEGQLNGTPGVPADTTAIPPVTVSLTGISLTRPGGFHTCGLTADATVRCWGANYAGQLGIGAVTRAPGIQDVVELSEVGLLASGAGHSCAASQDGKIYCWGVNDDGQVGPGGGRDIVSPREVSLL